MLLVCVCGFHDGFRLGKGLDGLGVWAWMARVLGAGWPGCWGLDGLGVGSWMAYVLGAAKPLKDDWALGDCLVGLLLGSLGNVVLGLGPRLRICTAHFSRYSNYLKFISTSARGDATRLLDQISGLY